MHNIETKIVKIEDLYNDSIDQPCEILKNGGLVAFPTETVYGLGALATLPDAVKKIFQVKGRPGDNPLIVHIDSADKIREVAYVDDRYLEIIEKITPGPITFVLRKRENIPYEVTAGLETVGVRIPAHPVAQRLSRCAG
ncbi:MAG: L-threonylcarbamoyladenylate synthase, partial [Fervidobacterium sp.]